MVYINFVKTICSTIASNIIILNSSHDFEIICNRIIFNYEKYILHNFFFVLMRSKNSKWIIMDKIGSNYSDLTNSVASKHKNELSFRVMKR